MRIDEQAHPERRSRNGYIRIFVEDLKEGRLTYRKEKSEKIEVAKKRIPPLARV